MITLIDSNLRGRQDADVAIHSDGALYVLRVACEGYRAAIRKRARADQDPAAWVESTVPGPFVDEYVGDRILHGFGNRKGALRLPIEDTPVPPSRPVSEWVSLAAFAEHKVGQDWGPAVQAAIDSGAKSCTAPATCR